VIGMGISPFGVQVGPDQWVRPDLVIHLAGNQQGGTRVYYLAGDTENYFDSVWTPSQVLTTVGWVRP
jgi:hypothetical protein